MTPNYFVFNGVDSRAMGVHLIKYPPIVRPKERVKTVVVPGRSGDLTQIENESGGPPVYEPYDRQMEISNLPGADLGRLKKWLRGRGSMIVGNEPGMIYTVDLSAQWQGDRILRKVWGGALIMHTQPYKRRAQPDPAVTLTSSGATVLNPGDVPAAPLITIAGTGDITVTLGGKTLTLYGVESGWQVDYDLRWVLDETGAPLFSVCEGDFGFLPVGSSAVSWTGSVTSLSVAVRPLFL